MNAARGRWKNKVRLHCGRRQLDHLPSLPTITSPIDKRTVDQTSAITRHPAREWIGKNKPSLGTTLKVDTRRFDQTIPVPTAIQGGH